MARRSVRANVHQRVTANKQRIEEAQQREEREAAAIRALAAPSAPVLTKADLEPFDFYEDEDMPGFAERVRFQFQWEDNGKVLNGYLHPHDCTFLTQI